MKPIALMLMLILFVVLMLLANSLYFTSLERNIIFSALFILMGVFFILVLSYALRGY